MQKQYEHVIYTNRRELLKKNIQQQFHFVHDGIIIIPAAFEHDLYRFRQESSFYYYTGINEPAVILVIDLNGATTLYVPDFGDEREKWVNLAVGVGSNPSDFGVDIIKPLGVRAAGYSYGPHFKKDLYEEILNDLSVRIQRDTVLFSLFKKEDATIEQHLLLASLQNNLEKIDLSFHDISSIVYQQRRCKNAEEIACIQQAVAITTKAHAAVVACVAPGVPEQVIQAEIEKIFIAEGAVRPSFPSIVGCGSNTTVLHYRDNNKVLQKGDLLVVDIGAEFERYAADLTRTYPVDGAFSPEQAAIYQLVLDAQAEIAASAKPGMFLRNIAAKNQSLQYRTVEFFKKYGYEKYFPHGIGHYMGLDVHDVGDYTVPLMPGDVFTIEPGLYLRDKAIGVRIEDDYLMTEHGAICLSAALPKKISDIQKQFLSKK